jgi:hypothetical protein
MSANKLTSPAVCVCIEFVVVSKQVSPQAGRGLYLSCKKLLKEETLGVIAQSALNKP